MAAHSRREFLTDVGRGMLVASLGSTIAHELSLTPAWAKDDTETAITFGDREPLVCLMQETVPDKLLPLIVQRWQQGTALEDIVAAAALANARTFAGEDYIGFHTLMALTPALKMAKELPSTQSLLPVLKVLYRNADRIAAHGGHATEKLQPVAVDANAPVPSSTALHEAVLQKDRTQAEQLFVRLARHSPEDAFNAVLEIVQDNTEVHRVVMPYRAWELLDLVGRDQAEVMLRQSVRYCLKNEATNYNTYARGGSMLLPKLLDEHKLLSKPLGSRMPEDAWVEQLARTIFESTPDQAAGAVAAALAEGFAPAAIGEALTLAANQLLLRDRGRPKNQAQANKPEGSVHGDSIGVHALDSANAWRNMARVSQTRNTIACLILGAWQVAFDRTSRGGDFLTWQPWPLADHVTDAARQLKTADPEAKLQALHEAIQKNDQATASALTAVYAQDSGSPAAIFAVLRQYAISEDGALHAEKFYRTVTHEFADTRPAFRWRHVIGLARVTASEYGTPAPGRDLAHSLITG